MNRVVYKFIVIVLMAIACLSASAREVPLTEALAYVQSHFADRDVDYFLVGQESVDSDVWKIFVKCHYIKQITHK